MAQLDGIRVAAIATDGVEETELTEPVKALREAGARVEVIAPKPGTIQAFNHLDKGSQIQADRTLDQASPDMFDAVLLPGGALNADFLRADRRLQEFLRGMANSRKPFAAICHAPWELISSGLAHGRRMTSYHTIQDDLRNAGAEWVDQEVVVEGDLVTSRKPDDIPAFNREMIRLFARIPAAAP